MLCDYIILKLFNIYLYIKIILDDRIYKVEFIK